MKRISCVTCLGIFALGIVLSLTPLQADADLTGWRIGIDPGHGGSDPGAVGPTGLQEKEVNLDASLGLRYFLVRANAEVYMTRTTDVYISLASRANFMNSNDVDRSVCVHHNSSSNPDPNWHLTYVAVGYGWATAGDLAYDVAHRVTEFNGLGFGWSNCGREGVYEENFYMLVYTTMPSILPEISFISNPIEEQRLYSNRYCYGNGQSMYFGVMDHLGGWNDALAGSNFTVSGISDLSPPHYELIQCYPNPFNPTATLSFTLPEVTHVNLSIYNVTGRLVVTLLNGQQAEGTHAVSLDGLNLPSGIYIARLQAGQVKSTKRLLLLK